MEGFAPEVAWVTMGGSESWKTGCAGAPHPLRRCSAITSPMCCTPGAICP